MTTPTGRRRAKLQCGSSVASTSPCGWVGRARGLVALLGRDVGLQPGLGLDRHRVSLHDPARRPPRRAPPTAARAGAAQRRARTASAPPTRSCAAAAAARGARRRRPGTPSRAHPSTSPLAGRDHLDRCRRCRPCHRPADEQLVLPVVSDDAHRWLPSSGSEHLGAVHLAERVGEQLQPGAVGVAEVDRRSRSPPGTRRRPRRACRAGAPTSRGVTEMARWCRPPSTSAYGPRSSPGRSKKASRLPLPMSKKKWLEPGVVAVLEDLGQRELEDALVELDGPPDVGADQREVVQAPRAAGRPVGGRPAGGRCLIRSRSAAMASRSIDVMDVLSDPEEAVEERVPELAVAVDGAGVHATVRRQHEAGRVEVDHGGHVGDAVRAGGQARRARR